VTERPTVRSLRVGVVGLGDIAQKAYLPALAAREDVELTLMNRSPGRLNRVARQYGVSRRTTSLDDLLDGSIDVAFVHTATDAHVEMVERLLAAGVHVLVDKPLAPDLAGAVRLVETAERHAVSLAVGFNRRFCPAYAELAPLRPTVVLMQKHRRGLPDRPRRLVFDDFIHVVDTLRFLLPPGEEQVSVWCSTAEGLLTTVTLTIRVGESTGVGVMHRVSGSDEEVLEVLGPGYKHRVVDLAEVWRAEADEPDGVRRLARDGWTGVPTVRGFTAMCEAFLSAVRAGTIVSARDALRTHEVCETVVAAAEALLSGGSAPGRESS
jgi:virulence factor